MRIRNQCLKLVAVIATYFSVTLAKAQSPPPSDPPAGNPKGNPPVPAGIPGAPSQPQMIVVVPKGSENPSTPARPGAPSGGQAPAEVKDKVESFKQARESFLAKQRELAGANRQQLTEEQRQALLETIKANQQELRARIEEIKNEFRNRDIDSVIEDVRRSGNGGGGRPRRGED